MSEVELPYIDEHSIGVEACLSATFAAVEQVADSSFPGAAEAAVRLLGCADTAPSGPRPFAVGSAMPGFHVEAREPGRLLTLAGRHRFSTYALTFRFEELDATRTRLRAESRARFPGLAGGAYRLLVIGTRAHVLATRQLLGAVKRRAERSTGA